MDRMLRKCIRSLASASVFTALVSATGVASAEESAEPRPPDAVERARILSYIAMSAGAAAMATGVSLYAVGAASIPEGCTLQSCDVRRSNGYPSDLAAPCARDLRADGCVGSAYNVSRQVEVAKSETMKSAGLITGALGAVAAAGGFVLWLRTPSAAPRPDEARSMSVASAHIVPVVSVGYGGVGLTGQF